MAELTQSLREAGRLVWADGMRLTYGYGRGGRVVDGGDDYAVWYGEGPTKEDGGYQEQCPVGADRLVDLNDPATVGVLASQARDLWGDPDMYCRALSLGGQWTVYRFDRSGMPHVFTADTEAEAWVGATLCAPKGKER